MEQARGINCDIQNWDPRETVCFRCCEKGHMIWFCLQKYSYKQGQEHLHDEKMDCSFRCHRGLWKKNKLVIEVKIGDVIILAVVDTGCTHKQ